MKENGFEEKTTVFAQLLLTKIEVFGNIKVYLLH